MKAIDAKQIMTINDRFLPKKRGGHRAENLGSGSTVEVKLNRSIL